jgi:glutathione peroxidase
MNQEPGTNKDVLDFNVSQGVTFPVLGKISCENGKNTHPLYQFLKNNTRSGLLGKRLKWNYVKFLTDANGVPVKRAAPMSWPLSLEKDIVELLEK